MKNIKVIRGSTGESENVIVNDLRFYYRGRDIKNKIEKKKHLFTKGSSTDMWNIATCSY